MAKEEWVLTRLLAVGVQSGTLTKTIRRESAVFIYVDTRPCRYYNIFMPFETPPSEEKKDQNPETGMVPTSSEEIKIGEPSIDVLDKKEVGSASDAEGPASLEKNKHPLLAEYLRATGNPMLRNMQDGTRLETMTSGDPAILQVAIEKNRAEGRAILVENFKDISFGSEAFSNFELSGDLKKDAGTFFSVVKDAESAGRVMNGEDPRVVLENFKTFLNRIVEKAHEDEGARERAYSAILARQVLSRIMSEDTG